MDGESCALCALKELTISIPQTVLKAEPEPEVTTNDQGGPTENEWSCKCGYNNTTKVDGNLCRMCKKDRPTPGEPNTPDIQLTENQWRCSDCTFINEIDWN